jgi:hypothetical protein
MAKLQEATLQSVDDADNTPFDGRSFQSNETVTCAMQAVMAPDSAASINENLHVSAVPSGISRESRENEKNQVRR